MAKTTVMQNEILRGVVGSTALGTALEGQDDRDEMGVFIEPPEYVCGLYKLEHHIERTQPEGVRSGPGDLDLTLYSLRKFCRLAAQGNPSILLLLWLPDYITQSPLGTELVAMRDAFVSKEAGKRFLGYLVSQRMKLTGEKTKKVSRPELVEAHGYDTKFAMHALRLGIQGLELLRTGGLALPINPGPREYLLAVRRGEVSFETVLADIRSTEKSLNEEIDKCLLVADMPTINRFLVNSHQDHWWRN